MRTIIGQFWALSFVFVGGGITCKGGIKRASIVQKRKERWGQGECWGRPNRPQDPMSA